MQADRRFVEHVANSHQAGTEAGGQPHALQLATAERFGRAIEGEIVQARVVEKF